MVTKGMQNVFVWRGPGWYGPVQTGTGDEARVEMVFVAKEFYDAETFERQKRSAGVMTTAHFSTKPEDAE